MHAQWLNEGEAYGEDWAEWWLSGADGARTVWEFTGEITALEIDDYDGETEIRTLAVDGDELDYDEFVESDGDEDDEVDGESGGDSNGSGDENDSDSNDANDEGASSRSRQNDSVREWVGN